MPDSKCGVLAAGFVALAIGAAPLHGARAAGDEQPTPGAEPPPAAIEQAPAEIEKTPPALDTKQPENAQNTLGGGRLAQGQFATDDLMGQAVVSADGKDVGEVAGFIINGSDGRIDKLVVAADDVLGLSFSEFGVDWKNVKLKRDADQVSLTITQDEMTKGFKEKEGGKVKD